MKTLIIVVHPNLTESLVNRSWLNELAKYPAEFTVHNLYQVYPTGKFDVAYEQKLVEEHEDIIFQFPIYWFSSPPWLKKWFDDVLTYGWAYGSQSKAMGKRKVALALTLGIQEQEYAANGRELYTITEMLRPFEMTFNYIKADYQGVFAFYGLEEGRSQDTIAESVIAYLAFLRQL